VRLKEISKLEGEAIKTPDRKMDSPNDPWDTTQHSNLQAMGAQEERK
jgi:hypothetical protein